MNNALPFLATTLVALGLTLESSPLGVPGTAQAAWSLAAADAPRAGWAPAVGPLPKLSGRAAPEAPAKVTLMRSGVWFVYPHGCDSVAQDLNVIVHFHGAQSTVIPRYLKAAVNAVLVIVNKGIGSGPYEKAYAIQSQVDALLSRVEKTIANQCGLPQRRIDRLALSSWSAGYGAVQQFLRLRSERVDAVLLADGLHVGFENQRRRLVDERRLVDFKRFAERAARGEKLMAITHSAIAPPEYAGAGETASVLARHAGARWRAKTGIKANMQQLGRAERGGFSVDGFAGNDKAAHSAHLYGVGQTSFARLREYWR
jgi:hypothetical protein